MDSLIDQYLTLSTPIVDKGVEPVKAEDVAKIGMKAYRAPSLFQPHRMREAIKDAHDGKIPPLQGYFLGLPSTAMTKVVALFGFDVVWIDWEHAAMGVETMTQVSVPKTLIDKILMLVGRWFTIYNSVAKAGLQHLFGKLNFLLRNPQR
jgi:hypothetical protein